MSDWKCISNILCLGKVICFFAAVTAVEHTSPVRAKNASVIIIGAGISGLGAADYLINEYNLQNVIILEALDRVGGRINPIPFGNNDYLEIGAQWIHGENNPVFTLAKKLNMLASQSKRQRYDDGEEMKFYSQYGCDYDEKTNEKFSKLIEKFDDEADHTADKSKLNISVGQLYQTLFDKYIANGRMSRDMTIKNSFQALCNYIKKKFEAENSVADWNRASPRQMYEYTSTVGESDIPLGPTGYQPVLNYFLSRIPKGKFRFNKIVTKIVYRLQNEPVIVETSDHETFSADHVIVTSSLGYLKKYAKEMFDPPLPEDKYNTIMALGFDTVDKVFLIYDDPFWDSEEIESFNFLRISNDSKVCNNGFTPLIESNLSKIFFNFEPHPFFNGVLLAFVSGDEDIKLLERSSDDEIGSAATNLFRRFLNDPKIPPPKRVIKSSWRLQPTILGSYSSYTTECDRIQCDRKTLQTPLSLSRRGIQIPAILFAGEATDEHQFQTTHGGLASGRREAKRINDYMQKLSH